MAEISFSLVTQATIKKLKFLDVEPAEAVIDVTGGFQDPTSLQKLRDAVSQSFEAHRSNLAELLLKQDALIGKAENKKDAEKLLKQFQSQQEAAIKKIEKTLQEKLDGIKQKAKEGAMAVEIKKSQFTVGVTWGLYKLAKSAYEIYEAATSEEQSTTDRLKIAKDVYDTLKDLLGLAKTLYDYFIGEEDVRKQIETTRAAIKKTKGKPTESLVEKLETQLKAHGPKIAALEKSARTMSTDLQKLLKKAEDGGDEMADDLAPSIDKCINQIIALNEGIGKAEDYHKRSQDALKDAQKKAVKDPSSWWDVFKKIDEWYEAIDEWFDKAQPKELEEQLEEAIDKVFDDYVNA
jgi:hypothetical protein